MTSQLKPLWLYKNQQNQEGVKTAYFVNYESGEIFNSRRVVLSGHKNGQNRFKLTIFHLGKRIQGVYHKFLCESFLGRKLEKDETVDHINGDPTDNRISNLRIESRAQNVRLFHLRKKKDWKPSATSTIAAFTKLLHTLEAIHPPTLEYIRSHPERYFTLWADGKQRPDYMADVNLGVIVTVKQHNPKIPSKITVSRGSADKDGYLKFGVFVGDSRIPGEKIIKKVFRVSRLIIQSFYQRDIAPGNQADHKNIGRFHGDDLWKNRMDNRIENLQEKSERENLQLAKSRISEDDRHLSKMYNRNTPVKRHNHDGTYTFYLSAQEAARKNNLKPSTLYYSTASNSFHRGFFWSVGDLQLARLPHEVELKLYKESIALKMRQKFSKRPKVTRGKSKTVRQIDEKGNTVKEFSSIAEAAKESSLHHKTFSKNVRAGKRVGGNIYEIVDKPPPTKRPRLASPELEELSS